MEIKFFSGYQNYNKFGILARTKGVSCTNLMPLQRDTVCFQGSGLKKSDFQGTDLYIIEKNKYNIQQFKSKDDLQTIARQDIDKLTKKDYKGRQEQTTAQRKEMLKEWFDYVIKENDAYSNVQRLVILSAMTKDLKPNNDSLPPVLNKRVLADTVVEMEETLKNNPKETINFSKLYDNNLKNNLFKETNTGESMTGWVVIPSKKHDPENFAKNVDKLKMLSHETWCTKSFNAEPYLSKGDFHVYLENGKPKLGVRFVGDKISEIQGEKNNTKIPVEYLDVFKNYQQENFFVLNKKATKEVRNSEKAKENILIWQKELQEFKTLETIDDVKHVFDCFGIKNKKTEDGLVLLEYRHPSEYTTYKDLNVNENKLFKHINAIGGEVNFHEFDVSDLGNLEVITGDAFFAKSRISNLANLKYIGGMAYFDGSEITSLGNLKHIGSTARFSNSNITDLGNLEYIGAGCLLSNSPVTSLGKLKCIKGALYADNSNLKHLGELKMVGDWADFRNSPVESLGDLEYIGSFADFRSSNVTDLGKLRYVGRDVEIYNSKLSKQDFKYIDVHGKIITEPEKTELD